MRINIYVQWEWAFYIVAREMAVLFCTDEWFSLSHDLIERRLAIADNRQSSFIVEIQGQHF